MNLAGQFWYVAYGSNLARDRFLTYLSGSEAHGPYGAHRGAADRIAPVHEQRVTLHHRLSFGGHSSRWDGATAFLDTTRDEGAATIGRGWLITFDQLRDVVSQESGVTRLNLISPPILGQIMKVAATSHYDALFGLDPIDGRPAVTITASPLPSPDRPTPAYLDVMRRGLAELGLDNATIDRYLTERT